MVVRRRPTLPHPGECSTIGAEGLSFRVRNVTGRFPLRYNHRNTMKLTNSFDEMWLLFQNYTGTRAPEQKFVGDV